MTSPNQQQDPWLQQEAQASKLWQEGRYCEATEAARHALKIAEQVLAPDDPQLMRPLSHLAFLQFFQQQYAEAESLYRRALAIGTRKLDPDDPLMFECITHLAKLYHGQRRYADREALLREQIQALRERSGPTHRPVVLLWRMLAEQRHLHGQSLRTDPAYQEMVEGLERESVTADHSTAARAWQLLAELYQAEGNDTAAELALKRALILREEACVADHPEVVDAAVRLARFYESRQRFGEAETTYQRALDQIAAVSGTRQDSLLKLLQHLSGLYVVQQNYPKALAVLRQELTIREQQHGPKHHSLVITLRNLAAILRKAGKVNEAEVVEARAEGLGAGS